VVPADLDHADLVILEVVDDVLEHVARGDEVGVENGDELAGGILEAGLECAGLVSGAVAAVDELDGIALGGPFLAGTAGDFGRVVGGIVEDLDLELVEGVVEEAGGLDDALGDVVLVVHGELDGDAGEVGELAGGFVGVVAVLAIEVDEDVAVQAVEGYSAEDGGVGSDEEIPADAIEHRSDSHSGARGVTAGRFLVKGDRGGRASSIRQNEDEYCNRRRGRG
jgi:hypothetical protein